METFWEKRTQLPAFPQLTGDTETDVLVIGGGMAGLLTAWQLQRKGIDTLLVERGRLCSGTTAGTTAKITAQHGLIYHKILRAYGKEYAQMYYRANDWAVKNLKKLCRQTGSALESKDNFVYTADLRKLEKEWTALQLLSIPAKATDQLPLPIDRAEAIGFEKQGQFDPLQLASYLAKDLTVCENTRVTELVGTTALTECGKIRARKIVVATHFPFLNKHGNYFLKLYQHRSYMLALEGIPRLKDMYVDDDKTGYSFSSFGDCFLLGGGGHRTGKQGGSYPQLQAFQKRYYPNAKEICRWAAQDTMSLDGIPYIGQYSAKTPDLYVAAGFNKWGMTGSMVSAQLLSGMITGQQPDWAPVFSPSRSILKPQLLVDGVESARNVLWPTTRRCPHLGCALKYNKEEHSWDCACHGSRFDEDGRLLNNPANHDMKRKPHR